MKSGAWVVPRRLCPGSRRANWPIEQALNPKSQLVDGVRPTNKFDVGVYHTVVHEHAKPMFNPTARYVLTPVSATAHLETNRLGWGQTPGAKTSHITLSTAAHRSSERGSLLSF
jgi:hypothetical protein